MTFIPKGKPCHGIISLRGDKSVSHRLVLFSLLHNGEFTLENLSQCEDVKTSIEICRKLGCEISENRNGILTIKGAAKNFAHGRYELFCGNSGTTARLLCGLLAGCNGTFRLSGDSSLSKRPMVRVLKPLIQMGAEFEYKNDGLPITIFGKKKLNHISYSLPVASAQLKSALLLAACSAEGKTSIFESTATRDHTERLLHALGASIYFCPGRIEFSGPFNSSGNFAFRVPGDISSAAFYIVAATLISGCDLTIENVLLSKARIGFIEVLQRMGADISLSFDDSPYETTGSIRVRSVKRLRATSITGKMIPCLIDELPALASAMVFAEGESSVSGASELRVKESDRIKALCDSLNILGIKNVEQPDGFCITGQPELKFSGTIDPGNDHRIAAALSIMALRSTSGFFIDNLYCTRVSFPEFFTDFLPTFGVEL
ncbi:MAG: 3-phosphoshikimate 1-carboxyvinyltransferase [Candidatus Rifleibacteriota bacterium]